MKPLLTAFGLAACVSFGVLAAVPLHEPQAEADTPKQTEPTQVLKDWQNLDPPAPASVLADEWQRWTLADGSVTWGPTVESRAYASFYAAVVAPARESRASASVEVANVPAGYRQECSGGSYRMVPIEASAGVSVRSGRVLRWRR